MLKRAFRFPVKRRAKGTPPARAPRAQSDQIEERLLSYPGATRPEELVYRALLYLGYNREDIVLQQAVAGGRSFPGGFVGDIIVYKPHPCLITVKGAYWHSNDEKEFLDDAFLAGEYPEYIIIWDYEVPTFEAAVQVVASRVGRPA